MKGFTLPLVVLSAIFLSATAAPLAQAPQGVSQFNSPKGSTGSPNVVNGVKQPTAEAAPAAAPKAKAPAAPAKTPAKTPDPSNPLSMLSSLPVVGGLLGGGLGGLGGKTKRGLPIVGGLLSNLPIVGGLAGGLGGSKSKRAALKLPVVGEVLGGQIGQLTDGLPLPVRKEKRGFPLLGSVLGGVPIVGSALAGGAGSKARRQEDSGKLALMSDEKAADIATSIPKVVKDIKKTLAIVADIRGVTSKRQLPAIGGSDITGDLDTVGAKFNKKFNEKLGAPLPQRPVDAALAAHGLDKRMEAAFDSIVMKRGAPSLNGQPLPPKVAATLAKNFGGEQLTDAINEDGEKITDKVNQKLGPPDLPQSAAEMKVKAVEAKKGLGKRDLDAWRDIAKRHAFVSEDYEPDTFATESLREAASDGNDELRQTLDKVAANAHYLKLKRDLASRSGIGLEKSSSVTSALPGTDALGAGLPGLDALGKLSSKMSKLGGGLPGLGRKE